MDLTFYVLLTIACLVLVLAMWACSSSDTPKWGPDLTMELPPHLLQEVFFGAHESSTKDNHAPVKMMVPSAPSELPCDSLLSNEHKMSITRPPPPVPSRQHRHHHMIANMDNSIQVLPTGPNNKLRPPFYAFSTKEPI